MDDNILQCTSIWGISHSHLWFVAFLSWCFIWKTGKIGIVDILYICTFCNIAILSSHFQMVCTSHFLSELQVLILLCVAIFTVLSRSYNLCFKGSSPPSFCMLFKMCVMWLKWTQTAFNGFMNYNVLHWRFNSGCLRQTLCELT